MQRFGSIILLKAEKKAEYIKLHAEPWSDVLATLSQHHIKNYSIFLRDDMLFSYLEYHGQDYASDMNSLAGDPVTQEWWALTDPCQAPIPTANDGEWWSEMEEVFHLD